MTQKLAKDSKWGEMFAGEELTPLFIPRDHLNPQKQRWLSINGQEVLLTVGEQLMVPQSIAALWQSSYATTQLAEEMMDDVVEIHA